MVLLFMNDEFVMTLKEVVRAKIHVMRERKRHETSVRMVGEPDDCGHLLNTTHVVMHVLGFSPAECL